MSLNSIILTYRGIKTYKPIHINYEKIKIKLTLSVTDYRINRRIVCTVGSLFK